jgi:hypothetical protein
VKLRFAYEAIAKDRGGKLAKALLVDNPKAAFDGAPLPFVPEIASKLERRKRKRFFFF